MKAIYYSFSSLFICLILVSGSKCNSSDNDSLINNNPCVPSYTVNLNDDDQEDWVKQAILQESGTLKVDLYEDENGNLYYLFTYGVSYNWITYDCLGNNAHHVEVSNPNYYVHLSEVYSNE